MTHVEWEQELKRLLQELFKQWDALGKHKDDDFGEVDHVMRQVRAHMAAEPASYKGDD